MQTGSTTVENSIEIPQKVKNITTLGSSNGSTGYLPKEYKNTHSKGYMHPYVYHIYLPYLPYGIIYHNQIMEAVQVSVD